MDALLPPPPPHPQNPPARPDRDNFKQAGFHRNQRHTSEMVKFTTLGQDRLFDANLAFG